MKRDVLSLRQLMVVLMAALLAPLSEVLPAVAARTARGAGWMVPLVAIPLLLAALWSAGKIAQNGGICGALGKPVGYIIIIMYMGWTLAVLAAVLRQCGARLAQIYGATPAFICTAFLLTLTVWMAMGKVSAFARAGEIFYFVLTVAVVGIVVLAAFRLEPSHFRIRASDLVGAPIGGAIAAGIILNVYPAAVLGSCLMPHEKNGRRAIGWIIAVGVVGALLVGAVIGNLGLGLTLRLPEPFLIMVQGLGIKGAFQRTEALVAALWTLSDLMLAGVLLHAWRRLARELCPGKWNGSSVPAAALAALAGGWLLLGTEENLHRFWVAVLPAAGLLFGLLIPLLIGGISCIRQK